jgi:hypothetical protein
MNKEFFKMQKLAGLITENQYRQLLENKIDINNLPKYFISFKSIDNKQYYENSITGDLYDENGNFLLNQYKQEPNSKSTPKNTPDADDELLDLLNLLNKKYDLIKQGDQKTIDQMDEAFDIMDFSKDLYEKFRIFPDDTTGNTLILGNGLFLSPYKEDIKDQNIEMGGSETLEGKNYITGEIDGIEFYWISNVNS